MYLLYNNKYYSVKRIHNIIFKCYLENGFIKIYIIFQIIGHLPWTTKRTGNVIIFSVWACTSRPCIVLRKMSTTGIATRENQGMLQFFSHWNKRIKLVASTVILISLKNENFFYLQNDLTFHFLNVYFTLGAFLSTFIFVV
jgi:hypothetical protein